MEIDVARITNAEDGYTVLRQLDARQEIGQRNIVLDLSSEQALTIIFRQVPNFLMQSKTLQEKKKIILCVLFKMSKHSF